MIKKKTKKNKASRKIHPKKKGIVLSKTSSAIIILALLCIGLFIVILALQKPQVLQPHAQTISGTNCRAAAGTCDPVNSCSTFETDGGQMDCQTGQTCCINPSTNANPGTTITITPIPSQACLGSCTSPSTSPSPIVSPFTSQMPSPVSSTSITPGTTSPGISQNPSVSPNTQTSTTPPPSSNTGQDDIIQQLINLIKKLLNWIMQSFDGGGGKKSGGSHNSGHHGGDKDHDKD